MFDAVVGAGSLRSPDDGAVSFSHRWTPAGVTVEAEFTGAHLVHLSVAGCVLNDVYREAATLGIEVRGVRVAASGDFDTTTWTSTGIAYTVQIDSPDEIAELQRVVDEVAEIPQVLRAGAAVTRGR